MSFLKRLKQSFEVLMGKPSKKKKKKKAARKKSVKKSTAKKVTRKAAKPTPKKNTKKKSTRKTIKRAPKKKASKKAVKKKASKRSVKKQKVAVNRHRAHHAKLKEPHLHEKPIGRITHYFGKVKAGIILIEKGPLKVGQKIHIKGHTTDLKQSIKSMQINHIPVEEGRKGEEVGIQTKRPVRTDDLVFLITR